MAHRAGVPLRRGWTTGACATAAARAAFAALLTGEFPDPVAIRLPRGETPSFPLARRARTADCATAGIVKDAGDDPDVTHRALILATVRRGEPGSGVVFRAGEGVGIVTKPGLALAVGEPAINPVPRQMMAQAIAEVAAAHGARPDVEIEIAIVGGAELAKRTMNARLGILGGLSVLGSSGIVEPFSCSAWIAGIHQGIDIARAAGLAHVAGATGRTSEAAVRRLYRLADEALIDMGDFAGAMLKYLRRHPVPRVSIAGGFGKMVKLAQGALDLHSGRSRVDIDSLSRLLAAAGASPDAVARAGAATSAGEVLALAQDEGVALADRVASKARETAAAVAGSGIAVEVLIFDRAGRRIGRG